MRYIIGEKHNDKIVVDTITDDPVAYAALYEPIDLINGEQYVWNDKGERFIFLTGTDFDTHDDNPRGLGIVETGVWSSTGPVLKLDGKDDKSLVDEVLSKYQT